MKGFVTTGLSILVVGLLTQQCFAPPFADDADGQNGPWVSDGGNFGTPDDNVFGDVVPGKNGWVGVPDGGIGHRIVQGNPDAMAGGVNVPLADHHYGINLTQGFGNAWEGCPPSGNNSEWGCGSAHSFDLPGASTITYSALTNPNGTALTRDMNQGNGLNYAGEAKIFIGDSSIANAGVTGMNGYMLTFESEEGLGKIEVFENGVNTQSATALLDSSWGHYPNLPKDEDASLQWVEIQIVVNNVGQANQSAIAQWRDVDDAQNGTVGTTAFTTMGVFDAVEGAVFSLDHIAIFSSRQDNGGASLIGFDNINVFPEPASLTLLGLGGLMMLRRRR